MFDEIKSVEKKVKVITFSSTVSENGDLFMFLKKNK